MNDPIQMMIFMRAVAVALISQMIIRNVFFIAYYIGLEGSMFEKAGFIILMLGVIGGCVGYLIGKASKKHG